MDNIVTERDEDCETFGCGLNLTKMQDSAKSFLIRDLLGIGSSSDAKSEANRREQINGNSGVQIDSVKIKFFLNYNPINLFDK